MKLQNLIEALKEHDVKVRQVVRHPDGSAVYTFAGQLPEFPCGYCVASYSLTVAGEDDFVGRDRIEALLRHFWLLQVELFASN